MISENRQKHLKQRNKYKAVILKMFTLNVNGMC